LKAPTDFFSQPYKYLSWQTSNLLSFAEAALLKYPPRLPDPIERKMALLMLDAVFHDPEAPNLPSVQDFHHSRTVHALNEIEKTQVKKGALIWKLYDMGIIIRTKSLTVAFDLVRGKSSKSENFALSEDLMTKIADQCDILFLSHNHRDHVDDWVIQKFLDQGKPVVGTVEILKEAPFYNKIIHPTNQTPFQKKILIGKRNLEVAIYPGHQGAMLNNVTLVKTPEGMTFCQTGDQANEDDFPWIDTIGKNYKIDILIPNCWTPDPLRIAKGFNPKLIIPAHENELGHTIDHREAYALDYSRWNVPYPKLILAWGESFHYKK
jgi:hypothetical protein